MKNKINNMTQTESSQQLQSVLNKLEAQNVT